MGSAPAGLLKSWMSASLCLHKAALEPSPCALLPVSQITKDPGKIGEDKVYSVSRIQIRILTAQEMCNFEDKLPCPIGYSIFEHHCELPCSHTFCRNCLENTPQESGNFYIWRPLQIPLKCPNYTSIIEIALTCTFCIKSNY